MDFDPNYFVTPNKAWKAPYPYCPDDVLFPIEDQESENQVSQEFSRSRSVAVLEGEPLAEQLVVNDSLGG